MLTGPTAPVRTVGRAGYGRRALRRAIAAAAVLTAGVVAPSSPVGAAGVECVLFEWAVPPGVWDGAGDPDGTGLLMDEETLWGFRLEGCTLAGGVCETFAPAGSRSFQDGVERDEWYATNTVPTVTTDGNVVTYDFSVVNASVPLMGQPRFESLDWTLVATLPSPPSESPSAAELSAATEIAVAIDHRVNNTLFIIRWTGTATETRFTSCTTPPAGLSIDDVSQAEGTGAGTSTFLFTVTRDHAATAVTVRLDTQEGTASSGVDYQPLVDQELSFAAGGSLDQSVAVEVAADAVVELDEGFQVVLSEPAGAVIVDGTGDASIVNDDAATLVAGDVSAVEGSDGGTTSFAFDVTLDLAVDVGVSVDFATADGTAEDETGDGDYLSTEGVLSFAGTAEEVEQVVVEVVGDERPERDETFEVVLSGLQAEGRDVALADPVGEATVLDDDEACPDLVLYRQPFDSPPALAGHAATAGAGATFEGVVDDAGQVTTLPDGPVSGVRAWGFGDDGSGACALDPAVPFDLTFAADAGGVPGAVVAQRLAVPGTLGPAGGGVTRVDLVFPPFDGGSVSWISVARPEAAGCAFRWLVEELVGTWDDQVFTPPATAPDDAYLCVGDPWIFADGFESGDTGAWTSTVN